MSVSPRSIVWGALALVALHVPVFAADYPVREITLIVPYPPGGPTDIAARLIAEKLPEKLGQKVVVQNKPGAATALGVEAMAHSPPDGYTIGMVASGLPLLPIVSKNFRLDIERDLVPITQIMGGPLFLAVPAAQPYKTVKDFLDYARRNPGKLNFAAGGASDSLASEVLKSITGIETVTVLYNGGAPVLTALVANEAQYAFVPASTARPHVESGKILLLAATGEKRFSLLPNLGTMIEAGVPGFSITAWYGLAAPRGTPKDIIDRLNRAVVEITKMPDVAGKFVSVAGMDPVGSTAAEFGRRISSDHEVWRKAAAKAGVVPQ